MTHPLMRMRTNEIQFSKRWTRPPEFYNHELEKSMKEHGQQTPITVFKNDEGQYELTSSGGNCRLACAKVISIPYLWAWIIPKSMVTELELITSDHYPHRLSWLDALLEAFIKYDLLYHLKQRSDRGWLDTSQYREVEMIINHLKGENDVSDGCDQSDG